VLSSVRSTAVSVVLGLSLAAPLAAQRHKPSYADLTLVRNRPWANASFLELRGGLAAGFPGNIDAANLADNEYGPEGSVYYHEDHAFGREGRFDGYVGNDGAYAGLTEGDPAVTRGYSRLELFGRQWGHFGREGFYESDDFTLVGSYRSRDWRGRLSFATQAAKTLKGEVGVFYGQNSFDRYSKTADNFTIPDDYSVWGFTMILEDNTLELDRRSALPLKGWILSAWVTREWNDSNKLFGITGRESSLPSSVFRGGAHLEWYSPYTNTTTFVVTADGSIAPEDDRVWIYDPSKPIGQMWVDGRIDARILLNDTFTLTPGLRGQWIRIFDELATSKDSKVFFGGQVELRADFGESFALILEYSYLSNESRRPVSLSDDTTGQHRLFFGFEFRPYLRRR